MRLAMSMALAVLCMGLAVTPAAAQEPPSGSQQRASISDPYYAVRQARQTQLDAYVSQTQPDANAGFAAGASFAGPGANRPVVYDSYYSKRNADQPTANSMEYEAVEELPTSPFEEFVTDGGEWQPPVTPCEAGPGYLDPTSALMSSALWQDVNSGRRIWANFDYLSWWVKGNALPPLVTTSAPGTSQSNAGVLGEPTTTILFGNQRVNGDQRNGGRISLGAWLVEGGFVGIEGNYYALGTATTRFHAASDFAAGGVNPIILGRPFFNAALGIPDALVLAYPGFIAGGLPTDLSGTVNVSTSSDLQSAGLGMRHLVTADFFRDHRLFLTTGYRFIKLDEDLAINHTISPSGGIFPSGTLFTSFDRFVTTNQFHGGDVGLLSDLRRGRWGLETRAKLAMGNMHEVVTVSGGSTVFDGFTTTKSARGLLAQPTNIGHRSHNQFVLIPEIDVQLAYQLTPWLRATLGYNFTYVTRVVRPGGQVDLAVNPNQATGAPIGPALPAPLIKPTNLWLQGANAGFEVRF